MAERGRCRDCNHNNVLINTDGLCGLCAGQLVLPLPPVRGARGRLVSLRRTTNGGGAR